MIRYLPYMSLLIGAWMVISGILHDIAVLRSEHGREYNRDLLRLLMDGHILITCGAIQMIAFMGLRHNEPWAYYIAFTACVSLLIYCAMIFPFLKSLFTITLNALLVILLVIGFLRIP
jgi:uncharacterized membrane protein HdeD (DUF308 family)